MAVEVGGAARWPRAGEVEWMSAAELVAEGFRRSRVVMMNEANSGLRRCVRTRQVGVRVLPIAWHEGTRLMAAEALGTPDGAPREPAVLEQPDMAELLATARRLGIRLAGYDADEKDVPIRLRTKVKRPVFSNWRDEKQAANLAALSEQLSSDARMLVWAANMHHAKMRFMAYQPMGWQFQRLTGIDPFVIDQTVTVVFVERRSASPVLTWARSELQRRGGEAGFIWREGMPRLSPGSDAWLLSLENRME